MTPEKPIAAAGDTMKTFAFWFGRNACLVTLVYLGFILGVEGAQYTVKFLVWMMYLPLGVLVAVSEDAHKSIAKKPARPIQSGVAFLVHVSALAVFVWTGHFFTASAWLIYIVCVSATHAAAQKHRAADAPTTT